jgi:hypothetical protein
MLWTNASGLVSDFSNADWHLDATNGYMALGPDIGAGAARGMFDLNAAADGSALADTLLLVDNSVTGADSLFMVDAKGQPHLAAVSAGATIANNQFSVTVASGDSLLYGNGTDTSWWVSGGTRSTLSEHINPEPVKNALDKVLQFRGYQFYFPGNPNLQAGMDARQVDAVADEAANFSRGRGAVEYEAITTLHNEAIKELHAEIAALRKELDELRKTN